MRSFFTKHQPSSFSASRVATMLMNTIASAHAATIRLTGQQTRCFGPGADLALTDEQRAMAGMAKEFAQQSIAPHAAQWDAEKTFPVKCLKACAEQGFAGIYCPPEGGGMGLTRLDASLIFEQLAAQDPSTTAYLTIHNMCAWMVSTFSSSSSSYLKEVVAPKLCAMEWLASYRIDTAATRRVEGSAGEDDDCLVINGSNAFIGAGAADVFVMTVATGELGNLQGRTCVVIMRDDPGVSIGSEESAPIPGGRFLWPSPSRIVKFDNVRISKRDRMLGSVGEGSRIALKVLDGTRLNLATCSLGATQNMRNLIAENTSTLNPTQCAEVAATIEIAAAISKTRQMVREAARALDATNDKLDGTAFGAMDQHAMRCCAMARRAGMTMFRRAESKRQQLRQEEEDAFRHAERDDDDADVDVLALHYKDAHWDDDPLERFVADTKVAHCLLEGTASAADTLVHMGTLV